MNRLTTVFLQQLCAYVPEKKPELLACIRRELLRQMEVSLREETASGTLYCSEQALQLQRDIQNWKQRVTGLQDPARAADCMLGLETLCRRAGQLHEETRREIAGAGFVDPARLHLFYVSEQKQAQAVMEELGRVELFRAAVLGGVPLLSRIPARRIGAVGLAAKLEYYKNYLVPACAGMEGATLSGVWAFQEVSSQRAGPMGNLAGYRPCDPDKEIHELLPGECRRKDTSRGIVYQGVGCITNLNPNTMEAAREKGIAQTMPLGEMIKRIEFGGPIRALQNYYGNTPYLVKADELFAVASMARSARQLLNRRQTGQCMLCGRALQEQAPLCPQCLARVKVS